jgi:hypothetical protein
MLNKIDDLPLPAASVPLVIYKSFFQYPDNRCDAQIVSYVDRRRGGCR